MGNVKWYMFNVHLCSAVLDISLSVLIIPYMLFPVAAGYSLGIFTKLGMDLALETNIIVVEIGMTILSILVLFENRFTFLADSSKFWIKARRSTIGIFYFIAWTYFIPFNFMVPDQSIAVPDVMNVRISS
uniref:Transmembrane protein n=1 Tax=Caenorhabditis tropicalis TaxID=1561998 RepID=A0A1I7TXQ5_9PELO